MPRRQQRKSLPAAGAGRAPGEIPGHNPFTRPGPVIRVHGPDGRRGASGEGECIKADVNQKTHDHYVESPF
jgi:hypothetical protein